MLAPPLPLTRDLVLLGGGHTHALFLRMWGMSPLPGVRVTVINPGPTSAYSGMLPGFVAGHYLREDLALDLVKLARFAGARLVLGAAGGIDREARTVAVPGRPPVSYDLLSVDIGITSDMPDLPGFAEHGVPAKPLGPFAMRWEAFRAKAQAPKVAVIGAGAAGAELSMAMAHALRGRGAQVTLIDRDAALADFGGGARRRLLAALARTGVTVRDHAPIERVSALGVHLRGGQLIAADMVFGAAGARPQDWLAQTGLKLTEGFIDVDQTLRSSDPAIFATGDCAHLAHAPRPKAGVYAVRQAPILAANLRAVLAGNGRLKAYWPQRDYLRLLSLGGRSALGLRSGLRAEGRLIWAWKDRIDRKFMAKFKHLPQMALPALPREHAQGVAEALGDKPMCGGCGAKVGRGALRDVLAAMDQPPRPHVTQGPGDDAAVLLTGGQRQVMTTDHLRAMMADPVLMTRIAAVHALGDVWAMGAAPQAATTSIILPRMTPELQRRTLAEVMAAATEVMNAAGAAIVGGHTSLGDEFTIGFTVTGLCEAAPVTLGGARPGDVLILTKPVGSGVVMAAEMAGLADGADVAAVWAMMAQPQGAAARVLSVAHAMTDVTGFGLAGHLAGICEASGTSAELRLDDLPLMPGAEALAGAGMRSTLFADNRAGAGLVLGAAGARGDLLFDPQTAGGLLAAVPAKAAAGLVAQLVKAGYRAAIIGRITEGAGPIRAI